ncbi:MAG: hypothetical protein CM15mP54_14190 [Paracoccaceae bacterium]|nr:MAG: hypothetical protein CM15mP54_14190 [Paracoccaceae bacterium]
MTQLKQEKIKLSRLVDNIIVRSPAEGIVLDIPAVSRGGIVSEGEAIVTLVQSNQPLFLEVDIDPNKIPDMKLGLKVSVKLDAMPFQEFGGLDGELIYVLTKILIILRGKGGKGAIKRRFRGKDISDFIFLGVL